MRSLYSAELSADRLDDLDQLVEAVAMFARELDEFVRLLDHGALLRGSSDGDAASTSELQQSLIA
jgi:hypothetical protein